MSGSRDIPPRLRDLLSGVGARIGVEDTKATGVLWSRWRDIVGDNVAAQAEPTSLRRGVLRVRTTSPGWATELSYLADQIKTRANEVCGATIVREVRVWTGPGPVARPSTPREPGAAERVTGTDRDEPADLRSAFERARAAWAARRSPRS